MNRNDFMNLIGSKAPVNRSMLGEVYELVDLFPYFQSAHMLLLKGLKDNDDVKFEKQLRSSAIHIADRELLYYLLMTESNSLIKQEEQKDDSVDLEEYSTAKQQTVIESAKNSELFISEIERDNMIPKSKDNDERSDKTPSHTILMPDSSENADSIGVVLLMDENGLPDDEKVIYMDPGFSVPDTSDLLELDIDEPDKVVFTVEDNSEDNASGTPDIKDYNRQQQTELIDKFIIANPRIEPVKEKSSQPVEDLSKPYVEEKEGFITETLARIYINQGYYSKAIDIFEKLSLKFPEKSSYFASQIEKVKEYIKK